MDIQKTIYSVVEELIEGTDLFVVQIKVNVGQKSNKITVLLDSDEGISIDECAKVSRKLGERIEEMNLIDTAYVLEVSSPGLDEPLQLTRQYRKNVGRELKVTLNDSSQKKGILEEVKDDLIVLSVSDKKKKERDLVEVPFKDIRKSNIIVSFK